MNEKTFSYKDPKTGATEIYDESGELVEVLKQDIDPIATLEERSVEITLPSGRKMLVDPKTTVPSRWQYSKELGQAICDALLEGEYLSKICDGVRFPPFATVSRWKRVHAEFQIMLTEAYEDRAELFGDRMRELAEDTHEDNASARGVQINAYKHLASIDSKRYQPKAGPQTVVNADKAVVIITGIARDGDVPQELPEGTSGEDS